MPLISSRLCLSILCIFGVFLVFFCARCVGLYPGRITYNNGIGELLKYRYPTHFPITIKRGFLHYIGEPAHFLLFIHQYVTILLCILLHINSIYLFGDNDVDLSKTTRRKDK
jgi:hypothetical protein